MTIGSLRFDAPAVQSEINVTPLIDVMLVLLMIMMLTAPMILHRNPLPLGSNGGVAPPAVLALSVKSTGELYLQGVPVNRAGLSSALAAAADADAPPVLEIRAEAATHYDDIAAVLALARNAGLESIRVEGARAD